MAQTLNKKSGKVNPVIIEEGISIANVTEIRKILLNHLKGNNNPQVRLHNIEQFDLSGIQLIYSLQKTCLKERKNLKLEINLSDEMTTLLRNTGFKNILSTNEQ